MRKNRHRIPQMLVKYFTTFVINVTKITQNTLRQLPYYMYYTGHNEVHNYLNQNGCTVIKVPHPKREGGPVLLLQNYPHPLSLRGRGPYHFPTPINT